MASNSTVVASLEAYLLATPNNGLVLTQYFEGSVVVHVLLRLCVQLTRRTTASAAVCAFYDHFLTLAQERRYIWGKKIGVVKVLYFVLRYGIEAGLVYLTYGMRTILTVGAQTNLYCRLPLVVFSGHATHLDRNVRVLIS